jgi:predicted ATPase/class 3 adenylate cyclase
MRSLPTGTVTFLFTDIEGSTALLHTLGEGFRQILEDHNRLLREAFVAGVEVRMEGDAFFMAFTSASDAVAAAVEGQRRLAAHQWPPGGKVAVRMGLHTGDGVLGGADYVGLDVHLAARVGAAAHGSQILVSETTRSAATAARDVAFQDLGDHRFKGFDEPVRVHQVLAPGLPSDFAPIRSIGTPPNNLPAHGTDFVGRAAETAELMDLIAPGRIVTLTGPSGIGKTRLAVHAASRILHRYPDGAYLVPLETIEDDRLVAGTIAQQLGLNVRADRPPLDLVGDHLAERQVLLILDNFEQVIAAAPIVSTLRARAPGLAVIVTSQALLRVQAETGYPVPPLQFAAPGSPIDLENTGDAASLFLERVRAADPAFAITSENAPIVAAIVSDLEGIPLALELAAARVRVFGLDELRRRLVDRFDALRGGRHDAPDRHRTLRAAIEWSHGLLDEAEQKAFAQLGVFAGGFTLGAAEAVLDPDLDAVEMVAALIDRSLVRSTVGGGDPRFSMLRTILAFSSDRLMERNDREQVRHRFVEHLAAMGEAAMPALDSEEQGPWLDRLAAEHDNIRAALNWCVASGAKDSGLRLAGSIWRFYHRRGHLFEGRRRLEALLEMQGGSARPIATGLTGLASVEYWLSDFPAALAHYEQALELFRELNDGERVAYVLFGLSTTAALTGDIDGALDFARRSEAAYHEAGSPEGARRVAAAAAFASWLGGRLEVADEEWVRVEELFHQAGETAEGLQTCVARAAIAYQLGRKEQAISRMYECLEGMVANDDVTGTVMALEYLAAVIAAGLPEPAVRIGAGAARLRASLGGGHRPEAVGLASARVVAERTLAPDRVAALWAEGEAMNLDQLVQLARSLAPT